MRLLSLGKIESNLAVAKAQEKKFSQQLKQMQTKKEKAIVDPEFRVIDNQIKTEKNEIKGLKRDVEARE